MFHTDNIEAIDILQKKLPDELLVVCGFKKAFLIAVTIHLGKQTMLGAEP